MRHHLLITALQSDWSYNCQSKEEMEEFTEVQKKYKTSESSCHYFISPFILSAITQTEVCCAVEVNKRNSVWLASQTQICICVHLYWEIEEILSDFIRPWRSCQSNTNWGNANTAEAWYLCWHSFLLADTKKNYFFSSFFGECVFQFSMKMIECITRNLGWLLSYGYIYIICIYRFFTFPSVFFI